MPIPLSQFLRRQLDALGMTEKEFAQRSGLGLSHVYQILNAERKHTRSDTLDKIAAALNMSPAEMAVAMGRTLGSAAGMSPDDAEALALYRDVPDERREAVKSIMRDLGAAARRRVTKRSDTLGRSNPSGVAGFPSHGGHFLVRESRSRMVSSLAPAG